MLYYRVPLIKNAGIIASCWIVNEYLTLHITCYRAQMLLLNSVAVAVQLATEMALNSEIVRLFGRSVVTLFGNPNKATAIAIAIAI